MSINGLIILADTTSTSAPSGLMNMPVPAQYFLMAMAIIAIALTVFRPKFRKRRPDPLDRPDGSSSLAQQRGVERQMQNLLVELSEMARQITAQLDTRSLKLELLLKEADEKIARLQSIGTHANPLGTHANPLGTHVNSIGTHAKPTESTAPSNGGPYGFSTAVENADLPPRPVETSNLAPAPQVDSRHVVIYALADEGKSVHDISVQLDRPTGEIELILALRPRR